tara:strand:- start:143 stop:379 length:237 start_codon:yes stop_codon:yes gene_type:complete
MENVERIVSLINDVKNLLLNKEATDNWIGVNEASKYCGVSTATLRRHVKDNKLSASQATGKLLFKRSELEKWLTKETK